MSVIRTIAHECPTIFRIASGLDVTKKICPPVHEYFISPHCTAFEISRKIDRRCANIVAQYRQMQSEGLEERRRTFFYQRDPLPNAVVSSGSIPFDDTLGTFHPYSIGKVANALQHGKQLYYLEPAGDEIRVIHVGNADQALAVWQAFDERAVVTYGAWICQFFGEPWAEFGRIFRDFYMKHGYSTLTNGMIEDPEADTKESEDQP